MENCNAILLQQWANQYETVDFIKDDPIFFPHQYTDKKDIEISAFLTSWIAFGNRKLIMQKAGELDVLMNHAPYDFIMNKCWERFLDNQKTFYRMFTFHDLYMVCRVLNTMYSDYEDFEGFMDGYPSIARIQVYFDGVKGIPKYYLDSPCKRICLFLRWLIRKSPVDLGIWSIGKPSGLFIPLDAHVAKMARRLGITSRKTEDWKMVLQVTNYMNEVFPNDPCRGDFALFGYSINNK